MSQTANITDTKRKSGGKGSLIGGLMPLIFILFMAFGMTLMFYPMMHMKIEGLPVAVVSYDAGAQTPQGKLNAGEQMSEKLIASGKQAHAAMVWSKLDGKAAADKAIADHSYYAVLSIPKDFSAKTIAAKQAQAQAQTQGASSAAAQSQQGAKQQAAGPSVDVTVDNGKSPMAATIIQSALPQAMQQSGITANVKTINTGSPIKGSGFNAAMIGQNAIIIPVYVFSMLGGMLTATVFSRKKVFSKGASWKKMLVQLRNIVVLSFIVALVMELIQRVLTGNWMNAAAIPFFWLSSFAVMSIVLSLGNITPMLGQFSAMLIMFCGVSSAMFPPEMLPEFWHKWLYPWVPHHFIGDGYRAINFEGDGFWNTGTGPMCIFLIIGLVLFVLVGLLNAHKAEKAGKAEADASVEARA